MEININSQQAEWLKKELEIMLEESDNGKCLRSQFSVNTVKSLLEKLQENHEE